MLLVSQRIEAPRMEPYMPLQGSIKRKLEEDSSPVSSINDIIFANDNKRLCLDDVTLPMGQTQSTSSSVSCSDLQHSPFSTNHNSSSMGVSGHQVLIENNQMNGRGMPSPFSVTPSTDMGPKLPYEEKNTNLQSVDQELQDLLEELTKLPDPSPNDLDLEKILGAKSDEPLLISHSQPALSTTPKLSPPQSSHLDNIPNKDFSGGCNSASAGSPQIRPSSAGTNYPITSSNKSVQSPIPTAQSKSQSQSMIPSSMANMPGGNWHAQQLKQLAASKQGPPAKQQVATSNWPTISPTGLSPPYRPGSSPQQPFSPQNVMVPSMNTSSLPGNTIQSSQNVMLSSISATSNPTSRLSPPYGSEKIGSPALSQQPFSPQNSMLQNMASSNMPGGTIKSPQNNIVSSMVSGNAGPSPPYQPEKLSSPALHQQPFSPQNSLMSNLTPTGNQSGLQNSLFKSMTTNQSKNVNIIMQQPTNGLQPGIVNDNPVDQFSFNNTKPLSHFAPDSAGQKMNLSPSPGSLIHYLQQHQQQQQQQQHQSSAVQQAQQVGNSQFLQQQIRQLMQPSRMQRQMQSSGLPGQSRQDPNAGIVPRMQEPGSIPSAGSGPTPLTANGYIRNAILKEQIMRRQQQVKPRPNMMGITPEQRNAFVAQQMNQFQSIPQTLRTDCVQPMPTPPQSHRIMTSTQGLIQTSMGSGMASTTMNQNSGTMVMIPHNAGKQPGIFPGSAEFNMPLRQNQNALTMNSGCQTVHSQATVRPGMTLSGYTSSSLINHSAAPQHLRQSSISRIPNVYPNPSSQMWTQSGVSRIAGQNQMDPSMQQFQTNPLFTKQNIKPNMTSQQFSHQGVVPPNQIAPGVRQIQKLGLSQANQGIGSLNNPNLGNNLARGQLAAINVMKAMPQGVSTFNQMNPAQLGPPSYGPASVQTHEPFDRVSSGAELHQYDFVTPQNNSVLSASCNEADFIDCLMKGGNTSSTDEDWLNNLTILDDILGQHSQNPGPV